MKELSLIIKSNQEWLVNRVLYYARRQNYTKYTSTMEHAWRKSISGISDSIEKVAATGWTLIEFTPDENFKDDIISEFAVTEAVIHRQRGVTLSMFMGLIKYYKQSFKDLVNEKETDSIRREKFLHFIERLFDRLEIAFIMEWTSRSESEKLAELQSKNRRITNEKGKYLTIFESLYSPVFFLNSSYKIELFNEAASKSFMLKEFSLELYEAGENYPDSPEWLIKEIELMSVQNMKSLILEKELLTNEGRKRFRLTIKVMLDVSLKFQGYVVIFTDINDLYNIRKSLVSANEMLEFTVRERTEELHGLYENLQNEMQTQRKTANALKDSEARFRLAFENANVGMILVRLNGLVMSANNAFCEMLLKVRSDVEDNYLTDLVDNSLRSELEEFLNDVSINGLSRKNFERKWIRSDGNILLTNEVCSLVSEKSVKHAYLIFHIIDITKRKQMEKDLEYSRSQLSLRNEIASLFLTESEDVLFFRFLKTLLEFNQSSYGIFGYLNENDDLICTAFPEHKWEKCSLSGSKIKFKHKDWNLIFAETIKKKRVYFANNGFSLPEGHVKIDNAMAIPIFNKDKCLGIFVFGNKRTGYNDFDAKIMEDIADYIAPILFSTLEKDKREREKERLETLLRQSQRVEALGTLAGGIAHDFNNILTPILGYAELALEDTVDHPEAFDSISEIVRASGRAKELVARILEFGRQKEPEFKPVRIQNILSEVLKLIGSVIPSTIEIKTIGGDDCGYVFADPSQVHQMLVNLCTNACHAMDENGGILEISLGEVTLIPEDTNLKLLMKPGRHVKLSVHDTGKGMTSDVMERIFDPYFTTKKGEKGTGLGLSVVHGIIRSHNGDIRVYSEPGKGSVFNVYLPLMEVLFENGEKELNANTRGGDEKILVVDDQKPVVDIIVRILEKQGYKTVSTTSSKHALELIREDINSFDLVISDFTMPEMTGTELAASVYDLKRELNFIICTGFSERIKNKSESYPENIKDIISKPIVKSEITTSIRKILDKGKE